MPDAEVFTQTGTSEIKSFLVSGEFNGELLADFVKFHRDCVSKDVREAFIYINSPGGDVTTYLSIQALMRSDEIIYHTIALGRACSAGCLLVAMGDFRWALPETLFMFHDASVFLWGKQREIEESHQINKAWLTKVLESFAKETNKPLSFWLEMAYEKNSGDLYFDSQTALEWGLIDYIGVPEITKNPPFSVDLPCSAEEFQKRLITREKRRLEFSSEQKKQLTSKKKSVKKSSKKKTTKNKTINE